MELIRKLGIFSFGRNFIVENFTNIEKRIIFLVALVFFLGVVYARTRDSMQFESPLARSEKSLEFRQAEAKIKGDEWKPEGVGAIEQIKGVPSLKAGIVVDLDSRRVLWSYNLKGEIAPASLAKVATVMTAVDIAEIDDKVIVSRGASEQIPTKLGLSVGEKLNLEEAVSASILTSANDAAETIADSLGNAIGDGTPSFMELVNLKLKKLGASDSNFKTATGLDSAGQHTTVYDLAIIAHAARQNYPIIAAAAATQYEHLSPNSDHKVFDLPNWNALLGTYPGVDGLKIGYTEDAGYSTMVTAQRNGRNLLAIAVGADSLENREFAAAGLLNFGFATYGIEPFPVENLDLIKRFEDWRRQLSANYST